MARKLKSAEPDLVEIECVVPNVWTSNGKMLKGDTDIVYADEAKALGEAVRVLK